MVRLDVDLGADVSLGFQNGASVILPPDGSRLVYVSQSRLFTRRLDQASALSRIPSSGGPPTRTVQAPADLSRGPPALRSQALPESAFVGRVGESAHRHRCSKKSGQLLGRPIPEIPGAEK